MSILTPARALELHEQAERRGSVSVPDLWVVGTVHQLERDGTSGHQTFLLSSDSTTLPCIVFRAQTGCIPDPLPQGAGVLVRGTVKRYREGAHRRLEVYEIVRLPSTESLSLEAAGEMAPEAPERQVPVQRARRVVPRSPDVIGIVTSPASKALSDILHIVASRAPWTTILLSPAWLRGPEAAESIADAIRRLEAQPCDVVLITSGGGSAVELAPFSADLVLDAIATCSKPVVSAVAHADDTVGADRVAALSCATPSLAAVELTPDRAWVEERLEEVRDRLQWLAGDLFGDATQPIHTKEG